MKQHSKQAFTLVELIVVITILAILGTIAFISLQGYSKSARDSKRVSDIQNIKKSLELFSLNTSIYPLPDNGSEVLYSGSTIWTQGTLGEVVSMNLSRNLNEKPTDPLTGLEYTYSVVNTKKEYELLSYYESDLISYNNLLNQTQAESVYPKIDGNYNQVFVRTKDYIIPVPSIINSEVNEGSITLDENNIKSQIITGGANRIVYGLQIAQTGSLDIKLSVYTGSINEKSTVNEKKLLAQQIQGAYTGSTLATEHVYEAILNRTSDDELISIVDEVVLSKPQGSTSSSNSSNNYSCASQPSYPNAAFFTPGEPTLADEAWQDDNSGFPCYYECDTGFTGPDCNTVAFQASCGPLQSITNQEALDNKSTIISSINSYIGCEIIGYPGTSIPGSGVYIAGTTNGGSDVMVIAKSDISGTKQWGCNSTLVSAFSPSDGMANTTQFLSICNEADRAPTLCRSIGPNWYLPAKDELNTIYSKKSSLGTFAINYYRSSTENASNKAYIQIFDSGSLGFNFKSTTNYYVRCSSRF